MTTNPKPVEKRLSGEEKFDHACEIAIRNAILLRKKKEEKAKAKADKIKPETKYKVTYKTRINHLAGEERFEHIEKVSIRKSTQARENKKVTDEKNNNLKKFLTETPQPFKSIRQVMRLNTNQALQFLEGIRWAEKKICPHCGSEKIWKFNQSHLNKCGKCNKLFNVKGGTVFEDTRVPFEKWIEAIVHEINLNGGVTAGELSEYLAVSRKTAALMLRNIRCFGFNQQLFNMATKATGKGIYQIDVTSIDGKDYNRQTHKKRSYSGGKQKALLLVISQQGGNARAFKVPNEQAETVIPIIRRYVPEGSIIYTDEASGFRELANYYIHKTINHSLGIYGNEEGVTTNGVEGVNSYLKCGFIKFRNNILKADVMLFTNAGIFRYNTRDLSLLETILLAIKNMLKYGRGMKAKAIKVARTERKRKRAIKKDIKFYS